MLKSMTGFGRFETVTDRYKLSVEMKSVNHRYLDWNIKMPRKFNSFETLIRNLLKEYIQRGKVDIFINYEDYTENQVSLKYNRGLAAEYMGYFAEMEEQFGIPNDVKVSALSRYPEVFTMEQTEQEEAQTWEILSGVLTQAVSCFVETRVLEGENLKKDLIEKLDHMLELTDFIEKYSPEVVNLYRARLEEKVAELLAGTSVDEARIVTEVTIFADKICVDEETVRLRSHIQNTKAELIAGGSVGRKLDFIAQEMNRESNTILSKASSQAISDKAIELKTEIEKVREQIQNIE